MLRDFRFERDPRTHEGHSGPRSAQVAALPQPLHLFESVAGSRHYHFGCFERADDPLPLAQDRLALHLARWLPAGGTVLDIGCGLGGTSRLLARAGFRVTAIDSCPVSVAYAEERGRAEGESDPIRFEATSLQAFARGSQAVFDGAVAIEVLQHFPALADFFACCHARLCAGGVLALADVALAPGVATHGVPYHREGRVERAAGEAGFTICARADLTPVVLPTLPALSRALEQERRRLITALGRRGGRPVEADIAEVLAHMRELQRAFEGGYLRYEVMALRRNATRADRRDAGDAEGSSPR